MFTVVGVSEMLLPSQTGELVVKDGVPGLGGAVTLATTTLDVHPAALMKATEYVPAPKLLMLCGSVAAKLKPVDVPVQPMLPDPVPVICTIPLVEPQPVGLVTVPKAMAGTGLMTTFCVATAEVHPFADTLRLYVPACAAAVLVIEGLCIVEAKPFGPLHV